MASLFTIKPQDDTVDASVHAYAVHTAPDVPEPPIDDPAPLQELPAYERLRQWGESRAELCGVSLDEWQNAVVIFLQTFGAGRPLLADLQNRETFWRTLEKIGWDIPGSNPEKIPENND